MPLVALLTDALTQESIASFSFGHRADHDEIDLALKAAFGQETPGFAMDPMPQEAAAGYAWLLLHQQRHSVMNALLRLTSEDLTKFDLSNRDDFQAFVSANFEEHQQARARLGI